MILLLGGTSETAPLAARLRAAGYRLLVSTATDIPLAGSFPPDAARRTGPLDEEGLIFLLQGKGIRGIVDATHPYATAIRTMARQAAARMDLPYLTFLRPAGRWADGETFPAADHGAAARLACSFGRPILLTVGARNLEPYAQESRRAGLSLVARVLPQPESLAACRVAGIPEGFIVAGKGPFSVEENRAVIRGFQIGVLVTKDSGPAGGVPEKLAAARLESCRVVVVQRPGEASPGAYENLEELVKAVERRIPRNDDEGFKVRRTDGPGDVDHP